MKIINLSYIISTFNRINYVKTTLLKVIENIQPDEEIVVIDGNSTDGSKEYLQQLFNEGKIHQFVSEPDRNQAHGWNKGLMMAKGVLIKKIIDDDVHSFSAIQKCKKYMLEHPETNICISNNLETHLQNHTKIEKASRLPYYLKWKAGKIKSFTFSDMSILIRKTSLSFLGLFDTQFRMMDWEYALRCSYYQANIIYYTGYNTLAVSTPGNITSTTLSQTLKREEAIGKIKYEYPGDGAEISFYSRLKIYIGKMTGYNKDRAKQLSSSQKPVSPEQFPEIYMQLYDYLEEVNNTGHFEFL